MGKLTATRVKTAGPGAYCDLHGLRLRVQATGGRQWHWRGTIGGTRRDVGLGSAVYVTLREAREAAFEFTKLARSGGDPRTLRAGAVPTFSAIMETTIETQRKSWRHERTEKTWRAMLSRYALPALGVRPVDSITVEDIAGVLLPIWSEKTQTAKRLRRKLSTIMQAAVAAGHRADDPAGEVLKPLLPKTNGRAVANHRKALPYQEVGAALATIRASDEWIGTRLIIEFIALTACRQGEARAATWSEIDMQAGVWSVPAERTKMAKPLRVPLSSGALRVLEAARELTSCAPDDLLFPTMTGKVHQASAVSRVFPALGIEATVHGLRASFRSWASESGVDHETAELSIGHAIGSQTVRAYARSDRLTDRRAAIEKWWEIVAPR